jgi:hypothetical protein
MYSYLAYGLGIHSSIPLPEFIAAEQVNADVVIHEGKTGRPIPETDAEGMYFRMDDEEAFLFWKDVCGYLVKGGREIIFEPLPGVEESIIRLPLVGTVLSAAVQQRGILALHASAVEIDGQAIAFLGHRGAGKSTMAAALYGRGHALLTDDSVALDMSRPGSPLVLPSFPQLKLFPEAAAASLGDDPETLPRLVSGFEKRARRTTERFSSEPLPLKCMYVLRPGTELEIEPLQPQEAISVVIGQSYAARIFKHSLKGGAASAHFLQCAALANQVPLYWLRRPRSLAALDELAQLIEEQVKFDLPAASLVYG